MPRTPAETTAAEVYLAELAHTMQAILEASTPYRWGDRWKAETYALPTGESPRLSQANPLRYCATLTAAADNAGPVWVGPAPHFGTDAPGPGSGMVAIAAGAHRKVETAGDIYAWSGDNGTVDLVETLWCV